MKNILVIKIGGSFILHRKRFLSFMEAIKLMADNGTLVIIVHGGGPQADLLQKKLDIPILKINGRRITDAKTLEVAQMVYRGAVNSQIISVAVKYGIKAIGLSGADGKLVAAVQRPVQKIKDFTTGVWKTVDFGYVGEIVAVDDKILKLLLADGYLPVIASLGIDDSGHLLNINADTLSAYIALAAGAQMLILVTDKDGVMNGSGGCFNKLTIPEAEKLIKRKIITDGMIAKIENIGFALKKGIKKVQVLGGLDNKKDWYKAMTEGDYGTTFTK